ncbi:hypothetical protein HYX70_00310 [Candidatus Saccharibacteria bacterium]|nr:hypothetical protein [Candidatus Saccharibacteria bacterium]
MKLVIKMKDRPDFSGFTPDIRISEEYRGVFKAVKNPSASTKKLGIYQPRLTYTQRPKQNNFLERELCIELSLPKLLFNNNFDELCDSDFEQLVSKLQSTLQQMNVWLFKHQIINAEVRAIHFGKNIPFRDYTSCSSILTNLNKVDISKRLDVQKTNFRNGGHILHFHQNSLDIAFYDKKADLEQSATSEKRSFENDNYIQLDLLDALNTQKPLSLLRFEVRLGNKRMIGSYLKKSGCDGDLTFKELFSEKVAQAVLTHTWEKFRNNMPLVEFDKGYENLLANILKDQSIKPQQALAKFGLLILTADLDSRQARKLLDDRFGKHAWNRLKSLSRDPPQQQYEAVLVIDKFLSQYEPIQLNYKII